MTLKEFFIEVRSYINKGFCQNTYYRDKDGRSISYHEQIIEDNTIESMCLIGAVLYVRDKNDTGVRYIECCTILSKKCNRNIGDWSDTHSKEEVLQLLDDIISELSSIPSEEVINA